MSKKVGVKVIGSEPTVEITLPFSLAKQLRLHLGELSGTPGKETYDVFDALDDAIDGFVQ